MKPKNWKKLSEKDKRVIAYGLFKGVRGAYIISQALYYAIKEMKKVKKPYTEISNIEDMEILKEVIFPLFFPITQKEIKKLKGG